MRHKNFGLMLFISLGLVFLWVDILLGHAHEILEHLEMPHAQGMLAGPTFYPFMWIPIIILPLGIISALWTAFQATDLSRKLFTALSLLIILVGIAGFTFHLLRLLRDLHGVIQWDVLVRLMRYPPLLAPFAVSGMGALGLLVNGKK